MRIPSRLTPYAILFLLALSPFLFYPGVTDLYSLPREILIRSISSFLLILWGMERFLPDRKSGTKNPQPETPIPANLSLSPSPSGREGQSRGFLPVLLYMGALLFSITQATNPYLSLLGVLRQIPYILLFFLVFYRLRSPSGFIPKFFSVAAGAGLVVSLLGIFQYYGSNASWFYQAVPPSATFGHKNMAAEFVVMVLPFSFALFFRSRDQKTRFFWAVAAVQMMAYILYAHSRAAWLAGAGGALFGLFHLWRASTGKGPGKTPGLNWGLSAGRTSLVLLLLAIHFLLPQIIPTPGKIAVDYGDRLSSAVMRQGSGKIRLAMWANTLAMIKDHPAGIGLNNWQVLYPRYSRAWTVDPEFGTEVNQFEAHNDYLQTATELSVAGLIFYLWFIFLLLRKCWNSPDRGYSPFLLWSLSGFLIVSSFSFPSKMPVTNLLFWLIAGLILAPGNPKGSSPAKTPSGPLRKFPALPFWVFSIGYLLIVVFFSYHQFRSEVYFRRGDLSFDRGDLRSSLQAFHQSIEYNPFNYWAYYGRGLVNYALQDFEYSSRDFQAALRLFPYDAGSHGNLGLTYWNLGRPDMAEKEFQEVLKIYPDDGKAKVRLKQLQEKRPRPD